MKANKKRIKHAKIDAELTNEQISDITGISVARVSNILNGENTSMEFLCKIAYALEVNVSEVLSEEDLQYLRNERK